MTNNAPLNKLVFDDAFFPALANTDVTLRKGELNILTGAFNYVAKNSGDVMPVEVTKVEHVAFKDLSSGIFARDGKGSKEQTLRDMARFYPDMTEDSKVTVVSYKVQK